MSNTAFLSVSFSIPSFTFTTLPLIGTYNIAGLLAADFNNDGKIDLAGVGPTGFGDSVIVALGNGDGTFSRYL